MATPYEEVANILPVFHNIIYHTLLCFLWDNIVLQIP